MPRFQSGEIVDEEFLKPLSLTAKVVAKPIGFHPKITAFRRKAVTKSIGGNRSVLALRANELLVASRILTVCDCKA